MLISYSIREGTQPFYAFCPFSDLFTVYFPDSHVHDGRWSCEKWGNSACCIIFVLKRELTSQCDGRCLLDSCLTHTACWPVSSIHITRQAILSLFSWFVRNAHKLFWIWMLSHELLKNFTRLFEKFIQKVMQSSSSVTHFNYETHPNKFHAPLFKNPWRLTVNL